MRKPRDKGATSGTKLRRNASGARFRLGDGLGAARRHNTVFPSPSHHLTGVCMDKTTSR